jgi:hypothetical protein
MGIVGLATIVLLSLPGLSSHPAASDETPVPVQTTPTFTPIPNISPVGTVQIEISTGVFDNSIQTPTPLPALPPLGLVHDGDGYRLQGLEREYVFARWTGPSSFLVPLVHSSKPEKGNALVHLDRGELQQVAAGESDELSLFNPDRSYAIRMEEATNGSRGANLVQVSSGKIQKLFDVDPRIQQLADVNSRGWVFGEVDSHIGARWVDTDTYLLTRTPLGDGERTVQGWTDWGKVLIGNAKDDTLRTLTERGRVVATLPDGSLLLLSGWIDGELQLLIPPYVGKPKSVAPSGTWTSAWAVSPDGSKVAWFEINPPSGNWSLRLPGCSCDFSPDPQPEPYRGAIWERATGKIDRFGISPVWWGSMWLYWRRDNSAVLYMSHPEQEAYSELFQLEMNGKSTMMARHDGNYIYGIRAESIDGSLYYEATSDEQHQSKLTRRYPDGRLEIACDYMRLNCYVDQVGRLVNVHAGEIIVQDLTTGTIKRAPTPPYSRIGENRLNVGDNVLISPDGRWIAFRDLDGGAFDFIRVK